MRRDYLNHSLNGDEACALGAGFFAARLSTSFRVRPFNVYDVNQWGLSVTMFGNDTEGIPHHE